MSQQEMDYGEFRHGTPGTGYTGYEGISHDDDKYSTGKYGQKLSDRSSFAAPTTSQRLALAIVSLAMLMVMTFGLLFIGIVTNVSGGGIAGLLFILVLFYAAVIVINMLFNRRQ
jgi:hypothetical protein